MSCTSRSTKCNSVKGRLSYHLLRDMVAIPATAACLTSANVVVLGINAFMGYGKLQESRMAYVVE